MSLEGAFHLCVFLLCLAFITAYAVYTTRRPAGAATPLSATGTGPASAPVTFGFPVSTLPSEADLDVCPPWDALVRSGNVALKDKTAVRPPPTVPPQTAALCVALPQPQRHYTKKRITLSSEAGTAVIFVPPPSLGVQDAWVTSTLAAGVPQENTFDVATGAPLFQHTVVTATAFAGGDMEPAVFPT